METHVAENLGLLIRLTADALGRKLTIFKVDAYTKPADELIAVAGKLDVRLTSIAEDRNLSDDGRTNARSVGEAAAREAGRAWRTRNDLTPRIASEVAALQRASARPLPTDQTERILREMRAAEIRRGLAGMDPLMAEATFAGADSSVRDAMAEGPPRVAVSPTGVVTTGPWIDPAIVTRFAIAHAAQANPEAAAQVEELELLNGALLGLHATFEAELRNLFGKR